MKAHKAKKLINELMQREIKKSIKTPAQTAIANMVRQANPEKLKKLAMLFGYTGNPNSIDDMILFIEDGVKDADPATIDFILKKSKEQEESMEEMQKIVKEEVKKFLLEKKIR